MCRLQAKGDLFQHILTAVFNKWGKRGLDKIDRLPEDFSPERWYPFSDLCSLLSKIYTNLGDENSMEIYQMGYETVSTDVRWQTAFKGLSPAEVFFSTKRQEGQYTGGNIKAEQLDAKHIRLRMSGWQCGRLWYEFYRGRIQAVMELTSRHGVVGMKFDEDGDGDGEETSCTYDIKWG